MANEDYSSQQPRTQQMPAQHARVNQQQYQQQRQQQHQQQQYQQQRQQQYRPVQQYGQQPYQQQQMRMIPPDATTTSEWVLNLFLVAIPILGFILLLVWAFGSKTAPSKKNWARGNLVWILIGIIIAIALTVAAIAMGIPVQDYFMNYLKGFLPK